MSFHKSNLGEFGESLPCDLNGYVPEEGDKVSDFAFGHDDFQVDFDEMGNGWDGYALEKWEEFVADAVSATKEALEALEEWQCASK